MARRLEAELVWPPYTCSVGPRLNKVYTASASEAILSNALDREDKKEGLQLVTDRALVPNTTKKNMWYDRKFQISDKI